MPENTTIRACAEISKRCKKEVRKMTRFAGKMVWTLRKLTRSRPFLIAFAGCKSSWRMPERTLQKMG